MKQMNQNQAVEFAKKITENHYLCWRDNPEWQTGSFNWNKFISINETNLHTQALLRHVSPNNAIYDVILQTGQEYCKNILKQNNLI